jgi:hypothetical protein
LVVEVIIDQVRICEAADLRDDAACGFEGAHGIHISCFDAGRLQTRSSRDMLSEMNSQPVYKWKRPDVSEKG